MEEPKEDDVVQNAPIVYTIIIVLFLSFFAFCVWYFVTEARKLEECSFYTIATPTEMTTSHKLYFSYPYKGKIYNSSTNVGAEDVGLFYTKTSVMSNRYWVQINCPDFKYQKMHWDIKVPDTLSYVPFEGWKEIPYDLAENK